MKTFENIHRNNIKNIRTIRYNDIKIGDVILFSYKKSLTNKRPLLLVLNPKEDNLLHGLVIDYMSLQSLKTFKNYILDNKSKNNINFGSFLNEMVGKDPKTFYKIKIKKFLEEFIVENPYRTYNINDIINLKIVDYNFEDL